MRKVYADVEVTVMLPVTFKGKVILTVDNGRSIARAIRQLLTGKKCTTATLEDTELEVINVGSCPAHDLDGLQLMGEGWEPKFHRLEVSDSK